MYWRCFSHRLQLFFPTFMSSFWSPVLILVLSSVLVILFHVLYLLHYDSHVFVRSSPSFHQCLILIPYFTHRIMWLVDLCIPDLFPSFCPIRFLMFPTSYSSGHLVLSHLGLAFVLMLRPFFPELVMSTDLLSFEHPSVLLFCLALQKHPLYYSSLSFPDIEHTVRYDFLWSS